MFRIVPIKIVLLLCLCSVLHLGAENKQIVSEMQVASNDTIFKFSYIYNNQAQVVVETKTMKNGANWENISQTEWFRQFDLPARQLQRLWANNTWNDTYNIRYHNVDSKIVETHSVFSNTVESDIRMIEYYYENNLKTLQREYIKYNGNWEKTLETQFFYASNKLADSTIVAQYLNNNLKVSYKTIYSYNQNNSLKYIILQEKNDNEQAYKNSSKSVYSYKANTISSLRNYGWNAKTAIWENDTKLEYIFENNDSLSEEILWKWNSMYWDQVIRYNYQYNAESQLFKKFVSLPIYRDWRNTNSVNYLREPNSSNMTIESVYGFWGGKAGEKLNTHISFPFNNETIIRKAETIQLTYIPFVDSSIGTNNNPSLVKVYPNPSRGIFYISNFDAVNSSWTLTGLNGTVFRSSGFNLSSSIIDISDLPNGIYLLNVRSASAYGTHKIVKY